MTTLPLWRSMMFVPVNVERFVDKAHSRGADAIILDLEDSIIAAEKAAARQLVVAAAAKVARGGADVAVRINRPWRLAVRDLEAVVSPAGAALALPKTADAGHVRAIAEIVGELEAERGMAVGTTRLIAMIETPEAYFHLREIAGADPRMVAMIVGSEDFALAMGMPADPDGLAHVTLETVIAARAAGLLPLGFIGSLAQFADAEAFRAIVHRARRLGFEGAFCIHPSQVAILNREYTPAEAELTHARRVIAAFAEAEAAGQGAFQLDGVMIDIPIVERAQRLLDRHAAIEARAPINKV